MESQLHLTFKRCVMKELLAEGYNLYAEPSASPVKRLLWSAYRPDMFGFQMTPNAFNLVFVECETAPTQTKISKKTRQIKTAFRFQKRLNEFHHLRSLLVIPPLTFNKVNSTIIRRFWEIWVINRQGTIIHKIPSKPKSKVIYSIPSRTMTVKHLFRSRRSVDPMHELMPLMQSRNKLQSPLLINRASVQEQSMKKDSIIFHVDMDHFFTAIEAREHPQFREKALIVGANPKEGHGRGVVSTCNYHARKYGITSGMPISQAWRRCPSATFLPPNYQLYRTVSNQIMEILQTHCPHSEPYGIDEAFLDMTDSLEQFHEATKVAQIIKQDIYSQTNLTCSVGVAPTKLIAKMASEYQKPDGLTVVNEADIIKFISPLSVRKLWGIGKKTQQKMNADGIITINDLLRQKPSKLIDLFGAKARYLIQMLHGVTPQDRKLPSTKRQRKSISKEHTFSSDLLDQNEIFRVIDQLATKIHAKAKKRHYWFKTITVKIRYQNFETHTYSSTLRLLTCQRQQLCTEAHRLRQRHLIPDRHIRLIGVKISNLQHVTGQQTLFA